MAEKSYSFVYSDSLKKNGQYFLDVQYNMCRNAVLDEYFLRGRMMVAPMDQVLQTVHGCQMALYSPPKIENLAVQASI